MDQAMHHYIRAKSIVDLVAGMGKADQEEIDKNKVAVLLNMAAVHMEQGEHAAACSSCTTALALDPKNVKGLVRRAQCYIARHEQKVSIRLLLGGQHSEGGSQNFLPDSQEFPKALKIRERRTKDKKAPYTELGLIRPDQCMHDVKSST